MAVFVGIDEAGYGPILGPLVVTATTFSLPSALLQADLWHALQRSVSQSKRRLRGRLLIADSKKAHSKTGSVNHLERTTLACLQAIGQRPETLKALLQLLSPDAVDRLKAYLWYRSIDTHTLPVDDPDKAIAASAFARDMGLIDMRLIRMESTCLDVAYFNTQVATVRNKATVLFTVICGLLERAFDQAQDDDFQVVVDRQGGRIHYRDSLQRMFPGFELRILREGESVSSYEMSQGGRRLRVHFVVRADDRCLPVSLASMVSKYLRELLVQNLNAFFIGVCDDLKPTAGYWQDGTRFIKEVRAKSPDIKFDDHVFIRSR
jgi:ribonuclease HII